MPPTTPSISIIVPNYNGGATIEATLRSLIDQRYPRLEILVVDGGSTDNSVEVIRRYEPHIAWWTSEKDRGQSHAIIKGFARASGDVVNWLCSDDLLAPNALNARALTDTVKGIYLPYWTFDASAFAQWTADSGTYYYTMSN